MSDVQAVHWVRRESTSTLCGKRVYDCHFVVAMRERVTCEKCKGLMNDGEGTTRDEYLGFASGTVATVEDIERVVSRWGLANRQQAIAIALWRTTTRHPSIAMTMDFAVEQLVVRDGGRDIRAEVRMFPPSDVPERRTTKEPQVTWRGSYSDLVTDLLEVLGPDGVERLCDEALPRSKVERDKLKREGGGG